MIWRRRNWDPIKVYNIGKNTIDRMSTRIDKNRDIGKLEKLLRKINPDYSLEKKE